jgi:hypothetical protein
MAAFCWPAHAQVSSTDLNAVPTATTGMEPGSTSNGNTTRVAQSGSAGSGMRVGAGNAYQRDDAYSLLPYTRRGYFGISVGRPEFKNSCGNGAYGCDDPNAGVSIYTGGLFNDWVGMEVGYTNTGKADRSGGETRGQGINVSLVLRAPVGGFSLFAKGGAIYGQTKVSTGVSSDRSAGKRRGWGASYGAGVGFDFTPSSGVVLDWTRNEFRFPGNSGREDVDTTSLGYVYRF